MVAHSGHIDTEFHKRSRNLVGSLIATGVGKGPRIGKNAHVETFRHAARDGVLSPRAVYDFVEQLACGAGLRA